MSGHVAELLVEIDEAANAVLEDHFPGIDKSKDVCQLKSLPRGIELIAAGFPCQDLSQAGNVAGIQGSRSGLVMEVFRLAKGARVPWILLENVPFMLQLNGGEAIRHIVSELENLGYAWAYRKIDTRAFGLPQRRERVFLLASREDHPAALLFQDQVPPRIPELHKGLPCGFYWTEGTRGLGWAVDALPTLKGGSTIGIPSSPAIWMPDGRIGTPDLRDCERMQGFRADWTVAAERVTRSSYRWKLVGNAVSVPAAEWIGSLFQKKACAIPECTRALANKGSWPDAAFGSKGNRREVFVSTWPVAAQHISLTKFLHYPIKPLSQRATLGFYTRLKRGRLRYPKEFAEALEKHLDFMAIQNVKSARVPEQFELQLT